MRYFEKYRFISGDIVKVVIDLKYNAKISIPIASTIYLDDVLRFENGESFIVKEIQEIDEEITLQIYSTDIIINVKEVK